MLVFLTDAAGPINVMLDLETWGKTPGCALRSIGAVMFDPYSKEMGAEFYANIDKASCDAAGLTFDSGTVEWWSKQNQKAQDALLADQRPLFDVADDFHSWFRKNSGVFVWSQGSNFDEVIWSAACRSVGLRVPWRYGDVRDTRTAYSVAHFNPYRMSRTGTHHNALDDARHQARCVQAAYAKLGHHE